MLKKNNTFVSDYIQEKEKSKKQEKLREKHHINDESITVVEKDHSVLLVMKFIFQQIVDLIVLLIRAALLILASIGIIALVLDTTRTQLLTFFMDIFRTIF